MAVGDYLNRYIEGWTKGDTQIPTGSLADNNHLDDPLLLSVHLPAADRLGQDHRPRFLIRLDVQWL